MSNELPRKPEAGEVAASRDGLDITVAFIGALMHVQDSVLRRLGSNYEVYRELRRDGQVHATFQQRRLALRSRRLVVTPGGEDDASIAAADQLRRNLGAIGFDRACGMMMWGAFYGFSVAECLWELKDGKVWLKRLPVRTPWRFRWTQSGELRLLTRASMIDGEPVPPAKFWTTSWGADNDDDPYGLGLAHQLYWPVYFKKHGLAFWLRALEKFGAPTALGKYPPGSDKRVKEELLAAAARMRLDGAVVIPEGTTLELVEATRGTVDQHQFNRAMNGEISKIVLGQTMTTDEGASLSQSEVHLEVREELTDADAEELCESFQTGPAAWLTQWNFPGAATPVITRPAAEDEEGAAALISVKAAAVSAMRAAGYEPEEETAAALFGPGWRPAGPPAGQTAAPDAAIPPFPAFARASAFAKASADGSAGRPAFAGHAHGPDAAGRFVAGLDWEPLMEEPLAFIERFLGECESLEEARDRLPGLLASMPVDRLQGRLAAAAFEARINGAEGFDLGDHGEG